MLSCFRVYVFGFVLVALSGCGGGGGGGAANGQFTVNGSGITFSADLAGSTPVSESISGSVTGVTSSVYLYVLFTNTSINNVTFNMTGQTTGRVTVYPRSPGSLGAGTYSDTVTVKVCLDIDCNSQVSGSPKTLPVSYTVTDEFNATPSQLSFSSVLGATVAPMSISISGSQSNWTASANQSWITLSQTSGNGATNIQATIDPASLDVGSHTGSVTVSDSQSGVDVTIPVAYDISLPVIVSSTSSISLSGTNGATINTRAVGFSLNNGQDAMWTATPLDSWLTLSATAWNTSSNVTVGVDAATASLASGTYNSAIDFTAQYSGHTLTHRVPVSLTLTPATLFMSSTSALTFKGGRAPDFESQVVNISLNTGLNNSFPWTASLNNDLLPAWITADVSSGSLSSTSVPITLNIDSTDLTLSDYSGDISVSVSVNGDTLTQSIPVSLQLEPHRLIAADNGIALVSVPGTSKLSDTINVLDNRGISTNWSAASDQTWLSVTTSGTTDGSLTVSADVNGLATDTIHYATVSLSSSATSVVNSGTETIKVGLYVGSSAPLAQSSATLVNPSKNTGIVADPIRPYVYVTHGAANIEIYNVYSGTLVNTLANVGVDLREMTISTDGNTLYVVDHVNLGIYPINLSTYTVDTIISPTNWSNCNCTANAYLDVDVDYTRNNGRELLITNGPVILDATTGEVLYESSTVSIFALSSLAEASGDGRAFYTAGTTGAPHTVRRNNLRYSAIDDTVTVDFSHSRGATAYARGFASNYDGSKLYRACWYGDNTIEVYDGNDLSTVSTISSGTNGGAILGPNNTLYCARYYSFSTGSDIWEVDLNTGSIINEYNVTGDINERLFTLSGDGKRFISRSNNQQTLTFTTMLP